MKIYFCVATIFVILVLAKCGPPTKEQVDQRMKECAKETGVSVEKPFKPLSFEDRKGRCFYACMMKKDETLIDGKLSIEKAMKMFERGLPGGISDSNKAILIDCMKKANDEKDECEVAGTLNKCIMEKDRDLSKQ